MSEAARGRFLQAVARWRLAAVGAVKGEPPLQVTNLGFQSKNQLDDDPGLPAGLGQKLRSAMAQFAHSASRKFLHRGYNHTALGDACGIIVLFWRVRPVVSPTMRQLAAR